MLTGKEELKSSTGKERCDIHVWSGACDHGEDVGTEKRFLCDLCENIAGLDHEVSHEIFSHVSGDYDNLS
jgi:hypothetical protein